MQLNCCQFTIPPKGMISIISIRKDWPHIEPNDRSFLKGKYGRKFHLGMDWVIFGLIWDRFRCDSRKDKWRAACF